MRRQVSSPIVVAVLAALLGYSWAQRPGLHGDDEVNAPAFPVAVIDLGKVFKGYKPFAERQAEMQREIQKAEETAKEMVAEARKLQEELKGVKPGSADHKRIADELQARSKEFESFQRGRQQQLLEGQSKLLSDTYDRIVEQVQQYAETRGIKLVVQFQAGPLDAKNPQQTVAQLSRPIVYHNTLDITDDILQALN
ncbi:MAG: OmpH family outer membrane protein [Planctomycetaceae bacterium]|nr:OmpH family outer membrane protein [Planctomycetaceae bacterium]